MAVFREGLVLRVTTDGEAVEATVEMDDGSALRCLGWTSMLGPLEIGNRVVVNTLGVDLGLGTGGDGFILWNLSGTGPSGDVPGHIVKMRYTPWQRPVLAAEAPESPWHDALAGARSLDGTPVVVCSLHSQLPAIAAGIAAARPGVRIGYLMTDGGALPLSWSRNVTALRAEGLLHVTATCGHAFGGDLETVNVFSGLTTLRVAGDAEIIVAAPGPGTVGTATTLGTTALEQGQVADAAGALGGRAVAAVRISFADARPRHRGISHHTLTALDVAAARRVTVVVPELEDEGQRDLIRDQLASSGLASKHEIVVADGEPGLTLLRQRRLTSDSMGRDIDLDRALFVAASAAGRVAGEMG